MRIEEVKESFLSRSSALAGVHPSAVVGAEKWIPAFAGKRRVLRTASMGHEYAFPPHRPNAGYVIGKETVAGVRG